MSRETDLKKELENAKIEIASLREQLENKKKIIQNFIDNEIVDIDDSKDEITPLLMLKEIIQRIAIYCGVLNTKRKMSDWLDIKPSVFHSLVLSKHRELTKLGVHAEETKLGMWCWVFFYIKAYEDPDFQRYWRKLDPDERKKKLDKS